MQRENQVQRAGIRQGPQIRSVLLNSPRPSLVRGFVGFVVQVGLVVVGHFVRQDPVRFPQTFGSVPLAQQRHFFRRLLMDFHPPP